MLNPHCELRSSLKRKLWLQEVESQHREEALLDFQSSLDDSPNWHCSHWPVLPHYGGQSSGGCKLSKAHGSALPHGILGSLCLRYLGNSQVECEVAHTVLKQSPTLGRAQPREWRGQDNRTLTLGPSEWALPTSSTSQKRAKPEKGEGWGATNSG